MKNNFLKNPVTNILLKPYSNSEVVSQILYGKKFEILSKKISVGKIGSINKLCFLKSDIIFIAIESENYEIRIFKIVKTR